MKPCYDVVFVGLKNKESVRMDGYFKRMISFLFFCPPDAINGDIIVSHV